MQAIRYDATDYKPDLFHTKLTSPERFYTSFKRKVTELSSSVKIIELWPTNVTNTINLIYYWSVIWLLVRKWFPTVSDFHFKLKQFEMNKE